MDLLTANDRPGRYPASWYAETATPLAPFAPLKGAQRADVCIVGAGYTGLSAALHLAQAGLSVTLLEAQRVGFGASGRNGGQVGSGQRQDQDWLERQAPGAARTLWDIAQEAKALVQDLIAEHHIDAAWRPGVAHACHGARSAAHARAYAERLARDYGYDAVQPLDRAGIGALIGSGSFAGGDLDMGAGHLHPLRFALGLARAAQGAGVRIHERSRVVAVEGGLVRTEDGEVAADHVILACNGYLGRLHPDIAARVMPINNFIVATEPLGNRADDILSRDIAVADDRFVVNYWRLSEDRRLLFGGGESYGYRFPRDIAALVRRPMLSIYPQLADVKITHAWGGTLAITLNRMPCFHRDGGIYTASGYSGHGVAMATMAGRIIAAAVQGDASRFDTMATLPTRAFPGGGALRTPLLALAMTWYGLRDRLGL
ncbi:NAD(P)/FAD-dependent oxidoreductase [Oceaniglobus trochenteri]|uniref:NAD(P)/FAD-dependent oxidoreductase n=1 Tax=Oceaniglobus trochenteri TaxID=2763260 RepID=UPI001CFF8C07|nr:FAD-binding oxidoreductase [Oceaniglobus trochenteri]